MTVHEVSSLTGVSIRTLQYYDRIGLLHPAGYTDAVLETLQQITLLELKKEHLDDLIHLARGIKEAGVDTKMDFSAFDTKKMDEYAAEAKKAWGILRCTGR